MGVEVSALLGEWSDLAIAWMRHMGHACLWGSLFILGAATVCRLLPRLPAPVRAWLWWLACLKLVFDLCWTMPIALPLLPAPAVRLLPISAPLAAVPATAVPTPAPVMTRTSQYSEAVDVNRRETVSHFPQPFWPLGLFVVWFAGVSFGLAVLGRQGLRLRRQVHTASPALLGGIDLRGLAAAVGLRQAPHVLEHPAVATPCITGWRTPNVLLPMDLAASLSPEELRLTLAHEMAHVRRGDLLLAGVPALARILFFFHPLLWWAGAEWVTAREEACDALALQATGASSADYGYLLLKMASRKTPAPALGLSSGYHGLRRRLLSLPYSACGSRCLRTRWLLACVLPLLLPWRLTAAIRVAPAVPSSRSDNGPFNYQVTDLGQISDGESVALNDSGQSTHTESGSDGLAHGFVWNAGQPQPLGALPKHHGSIAYGLNSRGEVAAASYNIPGRGRAFFWDGVRHRIGSLPGFPYSEARGVNDVGQVAGFAETGGHDRWQAQIARAFLWQQGGMTDLGTLGGTYSYAYGLNNVGTVVGKADTSTFGQTHAFAWANGEMQDLGTLGGANSLAYCINDRGQIVGCSEIGEGETRHAFLTTDGQMHDLGTLPGLDNSVAYGVNGQGDAVGSAAPAPESPGQRALLWRNGKPVDLNGLLFLNSGWTLDEARAINDRGQIAGTGHFHGQPRAFLLTPAGVGRPRGE